MVLGGWGRGLPPSSRAGSPRSQGRPSFPGEALVPRLGVGGGFGVLVDAAGFGGLVGED